jgi:hypothetical protein
METIICTDTTEIYIAKQSISKDLTCRLKDIPSPAAVAPSGTLDLETESAAAADAEEMSPLLATKTFTSPFTFLH